MDTEVSKMLMMCIVLEGIITYINNFFVLGAPHYQIVLSLVFGIFIAVAYKIDLSKLANIESEIPYIGCVLTGILFLRGWNYVRTLNTM